MRSIANELQEIHLQGLWRKLSPQTHCGADAHNFASNDYLGLAQHCAVNDAFHEGLKMHGHGAAASRLVCGTSPAHVHLEAAIADLKSTARALTFSSGYATAMGIIPALLDKNDFIIVDKLSHACLIDAAKLSGATLRVFPHNHLGKLENLLDSIRAKHGSEPRILIATESVFSMDGDLSPLREIVDLKNRYDAWLLLDEAHGFGVLGANGGGLAEELGLQSQIELQMGTLSKAAGLSGGFVAASSAFIDLLINRARSFIYSTAPPPALAHAGCFAVNLIRSTEGQQLRHRLQQNIALLTNQKTPIIPHILGSNEKALAASEKLSQAGFLVPAIRYPTVPRNSARLRISLSAVHSESAILDLKKHLASL